MKDVLGNHLKDPSIHFVHWLSITPGLQRINREFIINLERKSYLDCSSGTQCTGGKGGGEFGRVTYKLIADLEELETMDASEIYSKKLNAKK